MEKLRANDVTPAVSAYRSHFGLIESMAKERTVEKIQSAQDANKMPSVAALAKGLAELMKG